jgi:hypothetical protein
MGAMPGGYGQDLLGLGLKQFVNLHGHIFRSSTPRLFLLGLGTVYPHQLFFVARPRGNAHEMFLGKMIRFHIPKTP